MEDEGMIRCLAADVPVGARVRVNTAVDEAAPVRYVWMLVRKVLAAGDGVRMFLARSADEQVCDVYRLTVDGEVWVRG